MRAEAGDALLGLIAPAAEVLPITAPPCHCQIPAAAIRVRREQRRPAPFAQGAVKVNTRCHTGNIVTATDTKQLLGLRQRLPVHDPAIGHQRKMKLSVGQQI